MPKRYLYLVRHGQYDPTLRDELGGSLTEAGRLQAELTAKALCDLPINAIYTSSMRRTAETAEIIASVFPELAVRKSRTLWECIPTVPPKFARQLSDLSPEHVSECRARLDKVFERHFKIAQRADRHEVVVSHGNVIRYLVCRAMDVDLHAWSNLLIYHCGISRVTVEAEDRMFVVSHNDVGHLPRNLQTDF